MSWSNDQVLEFIELYKNEQLLWDPKHALYRNKSEVTDAWLRIQSSLSINCSVLDLKKKKESLMTSFRMHLNKKRSQEGYHTSWFAYPLMESFLGGKYECDSTNHMENEFIESSYSAQPVIDRNTERNTVANRRQKKIKNVKAKLEFNSKKRIETLKSVNNNAEKREMDEYDLYGLLLAKKLKKLDEHQRDVTMHEIDNLMFRAKMKSSSSQVKSPVFVGIHPQNRSYEEVCEEDDIQYEEEHLEDESL